ncbi:NAD(P)-dependent alcohol dehydrogenase [Saccharospirillum impatiens]|uniref:NAD(P)-dependent alcohol dehydrogenase n=1 Tax=Saccharospirillum impatiens TaxID=169438 RepID=UPI00041F3E8E|nr:NAD(P)-dependent alcohol dehydrogenase [Saccharospirillum impatiens]
MKAVVYSRYGTPDVLQLCERPKPEPKRGEVLIRVHATAINDWDWSLLRGKPFPMRLMSGLTHPKIPILGTDIAGVVEALGEGVTALDIGDRVYGDLSEAGFGGFAEYVCVPPTAVGKMPVTMSFEQAVTLPHAGLLALQGLVDVGAIREGESVLINGAGGGVGAIGIGIAKSYGCTVTGVDKASKLAAMVAMGFDETLDYEQVDFTSGINRYDLVLDAKTTRSPLRYLKALKPGGRYVTVGGHLTRLFQVLCLAPVIKPLTGKQLKILSLKPNQGLAALGQLFDAGALTCVIDGPTPLSELSQAMNRFGRADHLGKLVISVP